MKGYRQLMVGVDVIKKGDVLFHESGKKYSWSPFAGEVCGVTEIYRPIPKKARKVKKLNARHEIYNIIGKRYCQKEYTNRHEFYFDCSVDISRFIRRNYRRRT